MFELSMFLSFIGRWDAHQINVETYLTNHELSSQLMSS
ncbi:Unknown protein sequence [Pseudomonas syringae pv. syringae]|nr:Unknown protein sequence [Pseudomonas syringae pv. syringae]